MLNISVTKLRANLFEILKRVEDGEKVIISHKTGTWPALCRLPNPTGGKKIKEKPELPVPTYELIQPIEYI